MRASTQVIRTPTLPHPALLPLPASQSLEDIHLKLAQEITREMNTKNNQPSLPVTTRAPIVKPSPAEEELVRRIHRKVGGPAKLSTYDDPAKVRQVVIEALALEQTNSRDSARIRKGELSVFERRVVRTVTNRGAAVRSRMRQRKEVAKLKDQLRIRDKHVENLENIVRSLCSKYGAALPPDFIQPSADPSHPASSQVSLDATEPETESDSVQSTDPPTVTTHANVFKTNDAPDVALDQDIFGTLIDQMITHPPWC